MIDELSSYNVLMNSSDEEEQKFAYAWMEHLFLASRRLSVLPWAHNRRAKPVSGDRRTPSRHVSQSNRLSRLSDPAGRGLAVD